VGGADLIAWIRESINRGRSSPAPTPHASQAVGRGAPGRSAAEIHERSGAPGAKIRPYAGPGSGPGRCAGPLHLSLCAATGRRKSRSFCSSGFELGNGLPPSRHPSPSAPVGRPCRKTAACLPLAGPRQQRPPQWPGLRSLRFFQGSNVSVVNVSWAPWCVPLPHHDEAAAFVDPSLARDERCRIVGIQLHWNAAPRNKRPAGGPFPSAVNVPIRSAIVGLSTANPAAPTI